MISFMLNSMFICFQGFIGFLLLVFIVCIIALINISWNELKIWWRKRNGF